MGEGLREGLRIVSPCSLSSLFRLRQSRANLSCDDVLDEQFSTSSGRIVRSLGDLSPSYDMIIDALSDEDEAERQPSVEEMAAARWANERDAEVVCVDCPWGRERDSGEFCFSLEYISVLVRDRSH